MANKLIPKISSPGSSKFPTKGPHNPNVGTHGSGIAPRNAGPGQRTDKLSMPEQGGLARVQGAGSSSSGPSGPSGSFMPVQNNAMANLRNTKVGQPNPNTSAAATTKPKRKGIGAKFYGEY